MSLKKRKKKKRRRKGDAGKTKPVSSEFAQNLYVDLSSHLFIQQFNGNLWELESCSILSKESLWTC